MALADAGEGVLDPLRDREPCPLGGRGGLAIPSPEADRGRALTRDEVDLPACRRRSPEVGGAFGIRKLLAELLEALPVGRLRPGVEDRPGIAQRGDLEVGVLQRRARRRFARGDRREQLRGGEVLRRVAEEAGDVVQSLGVAQAGNPPPEL